MKLHKLSSVEAFVALDLEGASAASGPVRWARKILQGGAKDLARSHTYTYAALEMQRGGASAGISAEAAQRSEAVAAFVSEAAGLVADRRYLPDAAKGVSDDDLAPLREADPRNIDRVRAAAEYDAVCAAACADAAVGLDGRTAVVEDLSAVGAALVEAVTLRGGRVVGVASAQGVLATPDGLDPAAARQARAEHSDKALSALAGDGLAAPGEVWAISADVVFAGSKTGVVHHGVAERLECAALVPCGRLAFTSKALAVCRRKGVLALADFVALAGSVIAAWSDESQSDQDLRADVADKAAALTAEALDCDQGPFLGACFAAESFLSSWQDELPFGRPLAA